jgi:hypothetical protein
VAGLTRAQIRQAVARMLNDFFPAVANASGQTNSLTDVLNLARETDYFKGMEVFFSDPTSPNYNHIATITRSDGPTRTIFFEPPLATGTVEGETVELYNFKSRGTRWSQYNESINDAISIAMELHALVPAVVTADSPFMANPGTLEIPESFVSFTYVSFAMPNGISTNVRPEHIQVNRFNRTIEFRRNSAYRWNGRIPTFYGYEMPDMLNDDTDTTVIESEWLFNEVKAQILERMIASGMPVGSQDRLFVQERTEAGGKRPMIVTRAMPGTVRLV